MSVTYTDLPNTSFPDTEDSWDRVRDISASEIGLMNQYTAYIEAGNIAAANQILNDNPSLQNTVINATKVNNVYDGIKALQRFFLNDINPYIQNKKTEFDTYVDTKTTEVTTTISNFNTYVDNKEVDFQTYIDSKESELQGEIDKFSDKGVYSASTQYYKNNFVRYDDGSGIQVFLCIQDAPVGTDPSSTAYWQKLSIKGERGIAGQDGTNLIVKGIWNNYTTYNLGEAVSYGGILFTTKTDGNINNTPDIHLEENDYWHKVLDITVTVSRLKGTRTLISPSESVNFMTGEITSFNKNIDTLDVYANSVRLTENVDYTIDANNQQINKLSDIWDGTETPIFFEFIVTRNMVNDLVFSDGQSIQDGTVSRVKLTTDVQTELDTISSNTTDISTNSTNISINATNIGDTSSLKTTDKSSLVNSLNEAIFSDFKSWRYRAGHKFLTLFDTPATGDITEEIRKTVSNDLVASKVTEFDTPTTGQIQETLYMVENNITVTKTTAFEVDGNITEEITEVV